MKTIIKLTPEVPVDMTLAFAEGKPVGRGQMMFSTVDGRALYVPEPAGREIQRKLYGLGVKAGDRVLIRQSVDYSAEGRECSWEVYRAKVGCGLQGDGSFIVPSQPSGREAAAPARAAAPNGITPSSALLQHHHNCSDPITSPLAHSGLAGQLRDRANMLVDVMAACQAYARQTYPDITAEDVRACVVAAAAALAPKVKS